MTINQESKKDKDCQDNTNEDSRKQDPKSPTHSIKGTITPDGNNRGTYRATLLGYYGQNWPQYIAEFEASYRIPKPAPSATDECSATWVNEPPKDVLYGEEIALVLDVNLNPVGVTAAEADLFLISFVDFHPYTVDDWAENQRPEGQFCNGGKVTGTIQGDGKMRFAWAEAVISDDVVADGYHMLGAEIRSFPEGDGNGWVGRFVFEEGMVNVG